MAQTKTSAQRKSGEADRAVVRDNVGALRKIAAKYPGVEETIACKGTAVESSAFKAGKKTFLFVRAADARLKLEKSLPEAASLAKKEPGRYEAGAMGWIKVQLGPEPPPLDLLKRWIDESYRLMAAAAPAKNKKAPNKS